MNEQSAEVNVRRTWTQQKKEPNTWKPWINLLPWNNLQKKSIGSMETVLYMEMNFISFTPTSWEKK